MHGGERIGQVWQAALAGTRFRFTLIDDRNREDEASLYVDAQVKGDTMEGTMRRGVGGESMVVPWRAVRAAR